MSIPIEANNSNLTTIVMPVYHEGDGVIPVIATLFLTIHYPIELIVVYDSENDETIETIEKLKQIFDGIHLIKNEWKQGVLNAIKTGFKHADTEYVGIWISYHVDPFGILNEMIKKLESGFDLVSATRFTTDTKKARGHVVKKLLSFLGNFVLNKVIGMPITDVTTSLKVYRKSLLDDIPIETDFNGGWALSSELAIKAAIKGYRIGEIPLERKNVNLIHGLTNFRVFRHLTAYFHWLYLGWKNRKLIKKQLSDQLKESSEINP